MQWTDEPNAGFSRARPSRLIRPVTEGTFGPMAVNVAAQRRDPDSLLNWMERLIRRRRETPEIGWGAWKVLDARLPAVLAHRSDWDGRTFVAIHNLSEEPCVARVRLGTDVPEDPRVHDLLDTTAAASHELRGQRAGRQARRVRLSMVPHPGARAAHLAVADRREVGDPGCSTASSLRVASSPSSSCPRTPRR